MMNISKFSVFRKCVVQCTRNTRNVSSLDCIVRRPIVVTITGVNSKVGKALALLLKQSRYVDVLRVYDVKPGPCGIALDLSHINTNCQVRGYEGLDMLKPAVQGAHIVVVSGGEAAKGGHPQRQLFKANAKYVHYIALHTSEFNPKGILCIETPPVTAMVPLASEEYKKAHVYNPKKIMGVTSISVTRSNSIVGDFTRKEAHSIKCPIVGSACPKTVVPVLSQADVGNTPLDTTALDILHAKITDAETDVLKQRYIEDVSPCTASIAYSTARFVNSVAKGLLKEFTGWECAFVRQTGHIGKFLPYMASIITLGNQGVQHIRMPKLSKQECIYLQKASDIIRQQIEWGEGFVTAASFADRKRRLIPCRVGAPSCSLIKVRNILGVGDVIFDSENKENKKTTKQLKS